MKINNKNNTIVCSECGEEIFEAEITRESVYPNAIIVTVTCEECDAVYKVFTGESEWLTE